MSGRARVSVIYEEEKYLTRGKDSNGRGWRGNEDMLRVGREGEEGKEQQRRGKGKGKGGKGGQRGKCGRKEERRGREREKRGEETRR